MVCDICNRPGSHELVSSGTLRLTVGKGFNPFTLPHVPNVSSMLGVPSDYQFLQWKQRLNMDS